MDDHVEDDTDRDKGGDGEAGIEDYHEDGEEELDFFEDDEDVEM